MSNNGGAAGLTSESTAVQEMTVESILKVEKDSGPSSQNNSISMEKGEIYSEHETTDGDEDLNALTAFSHEYPFPINPDDPIETQQFTFRAVFVGCLLGAVISASKYVSCPLFH